MSFDMKPLEDLGTVIADAMGEGPSEDRLMEQRRDFLSHVAQTRRGGGRIQVFALAAAAAAVIAAVLGIVFKLNMEEPLPFWIGSDRTAGTEGQWVRAESAALLPIRFQGGSEVSLSSDAAARIITSTTDAVRIDLATGKVDCSINGNHHTTWQVEAGPYTVKVTGTVFSTEWHPNGSKLDVTVSRGSVLVTGANLNSHGVQLSVGDHLRVDGEKALIALNPESTEEPSAEVDVASSVEVAPEPEIAPVLTQDDHSGSNEAPAQSERVRISTPKNAPADQSELDRLIAEGDVEALWQFAMQARYNRNGADAKSALMTIRERFGSSKRAETAAFVLGRVYLELQGSPAGAAKWFKRYLSETPNGPLAEEALGRLFDAYDRSGRAETAKRYAEQYLSKYPSGLFAESARQVLNR